MTIPDLSYFLLGGICVFTILTALWVVLSPNLIHSAVSLLFTLFGIAGLYVFLYADFIAATQIIIYVGVHRMTMKLIYIGKNFSINVLGILINKI